MSLESSLHTPRSSPTWVPLYRVGAIAAFAMVALMLFQMVCFLAVPPPGFSPSHQSALDWLTLLSARPLLALIHLDGLMLFDYVLVLLLFVALWAALQCARPVTMLLGILLSAVGAAVYFASNPAFTMLSLAQQYAVATSDLSRAELLAAAQGVLAVYHGTPFDVAYVLSAVSGLLVCSAMISTPVFTPTTAYVGLVAYTLALVPATAGAVGLVLSIVSLFPLAGWLVLVAHKLWTAGSALRPPLRTARARSREA